MLQRNRDSLLTGLSSCSTSYSSSNADNSAAVYLWDIRRPQRPAASLDVAGYSLPLHSQPVSAECYHTAADASDGFQLPIDTPIRTLPATVDIQQAVSASQRGVTCLAVHDDGVLAAAGCQDGTTLVWDMRKVRGDGQLNTGANRCHVPLIACQMSQECRPYWFSEAFWSAHSSTLSTGTSNSMPVCEGMLWFGPTPHIRFAACLQLGVLHGARR